MSAAQTSVTQKLHVAYVVKSFPVLSQVTVINELLALEEIGVDTTVVPIAPARLAPAHAAVDRLRGRVLHWQQDRRQDGQQDRRGRPAVLRSNLTTLLRARPAAYREARDLVERIGMLSGARAFARLADLAARLRERGVRHLHAHFAAEAATLAEALSLLTGLPFSFTAHAYDIFLRPERLEEKLQRAAFAVTVSEYNRRYLLQCYPQTPPGKLHVIRPGVDLARFAPRAERPAENGCLHILSVGRLVEKKGYADLIAACGLLAGRGVDFRCTIVGEGPLRAELEAAVEGHQLGARVVLPGALYQEQIVPLLQQADVFALPCVIARDGDRDAMPLAVAEAMAAGLPVVSTRVVGLPELVRDGDGAGILVPPHSPALLAQALEQVQQAGVKGRTAMGRRARAVIEQDFDARRETRRLAQLFARCAGERAP